MLSSFKAIFYRNFQCSKSIVYYLIFLLIFLLLFSNLKQSIVLVTMVVSVYLLTTQSNEVCILTVLDKQQKFKIIYKIMGLKDKEYLFANVVFFSLKMFSLFFICTTSNLLIDFYNHDWDYDLKIIHYYCKLNLLAFFVSIQAAILNQTISYAFSNVKVVQNLSVWINFLLLASGIFFAMNEKLSWLRYLFPYSSFMRFQLLSLLDQYTKIEVADYREEIFPSLLSIFVMSLILYCVDFLVPREDDYQPRVGDLFRRHPRYRPNLNLQERLLEEESRSELVLQDLGKDFGSFKALQNLNIKLKKGETICLLGHNGAGKSTLINILTGIYKPTTGNITFQGHDFRDLQKMGITRIGICPAFDVLYEQMTVYNHLVMISHIKDSINSDEKIQKIMRNLDLEKYKDFEVKKLSGGYKRRLMLALSLFDEPDFLFLDEPTSSIDPESRKEIWEFLLQLKINRSETITFLTTHHLEEAELLADKIDVLVKGQIYCEGTVEQLKQKFGIGYTIEVVNENEKTDMSIKFQNMQQELIEKFGLENQDFSQQQRKFVMEVGIQNKHMINQLIQYVDNNKPQNTFLVINSNSLEEAYIEIENQANLNELKYTDKEIAQLFENLFKDNDKNKKNKFLLMMKMTFNYVFCDFFQIFGYFGYYIIHIVLLFCIMKYLYERKITTSVHNLLGFVTNMALIESFVNVIVTYNIVVEKNQNIRQVLKANKVGFFTYYFGKYTTHIILNIFTTAIIVTSSVFFNYGFQDFVLYDFYFWIDSYFYVFVRKISFFVLCFLIALIFDQPKTTLKYFSALYILMSLIISILQFKFSEYFCLLFDYNLFIFSVQNQLRFYLYVLAILGQFILYTSLLYIIENYNENYNQNYQEVEKPKNDLNLDDFQKTVQTEGQKAFANEQRKLRVQRLKKRYDKKLVVKDTSFGLDQSQNLGFLGPNGAGKSTTVNCLLSKIKKTSGNIIYNQKVEKLSFIDMLLNQNKSIYFQHNFGIVNQNNSFWENMRCRDIINFFLDLNGISRDKFKQLLEIFQFDYYMKNTVEQLSSGNQRKLCIILSFLNNPEFIVYDEATCGVDLIMRLKLKSIFDYFKDKNKSTGLITTHFLKDIEIFCEKITIINDGQLLYFDYLDKLRNKVGGYKLKLYYKDASKTEQLMQLKEELQRFSQVGQILNTGNQYQQRAIEYHLIQIHDFSQLFNMIEQHQESGDIDEFSIRQLSIDDIYLEIINSQNQ